PTPTSPACAGRRRWDEVAGALTRSLAESRPDGEWPPEPGRTLDRWRVADGEVDPHRPAPGPRAGRGGHWIADQFPKGEASGGSLPGWGTGNAPARMGAAAREAARTNGPPSGPRSRRSRTAGCPPP